MADVNYTGVVLPDLLIADIIDSELVALQQDPVSLANFFKKLDQVELDTFLNYLTQKQVGVHTGWSTQLVFETPQIVITAAAAQDDRFIGNQIIEGIVAVEGVSATLSQDFPLTSQVFDPTNAPLTLSVSGFQGTWPNEGIIKVDEEVMSFDGKNANALTIIRRGLRGTDIAAHTAGAQVTLEEKKRIYGLDEVGSYWVDVVHSNPHFVIALALLVKVALLRAEQQDLFGSQGVNEITMTATDVAPHRPLYPNTVFVRSLNFRCRYTIALDERLQLIHRPEAQGTIETPSYVEA